MWLVVCELYERNWSLLLDKFICAKPNDAKHDSSISNNNNTSNNIKAAQSSLIFKSMLEKTTITTTEMLFIHKLFTVIQGNTKDL